MVVALCRLTLHESLFFATREVGRLYETGRYLHNYALTYALGLVSTPYRHTDALPRYAEELAALNAAGVYVTPARPLAVEFALTTFKYADNRYRVKMTPGSRNTPSYGRAKELAVGSRFEFAVVSPQPPALPRWIRLGKWMSKAALEVVATQEVGEARTSAFTHGWPVNPLDLPPTCRALAYDIISMPPVSLLDHAALDGPHYVLAALPNQPCLAADLAYRFPAEGASAGKGVGP